MTEQGRFEGGVHEYIDSLEARIEALTKPRPMSEAPRDGTVILAFITTDHRPYPMYWRSIGARDHGDCLDDLAESWLMVWDEYQMPAYQLLGWLPCPTYTGEAVE